jgi:hypothetical protein
MNTKEQFRIEALTSSFTSLTIPATLEKLCSSNDGLAKEEFKHLSVHG